MVFFLFNMTELSAIKHTKGRAVRAYSLNIANIPSRLTRPSTSSATFEYVPNTTSVSSIETQAQKCDPLTVLIPITDGMIIIMAVIFLVALGIVALIVAMAIMKVYFAKGKVHSIWTDD